VLGEKLLQFLFNQIDDLLLFDEIHFVQENEDILDTDLSAEEDVLLGLGHGAVGGSHYQDTGVHFGGSCDHVFHVIDVTRAIDVGVVSFLSLVLKSGGVDGDTSGFFLGCLVDFSVLNVLGFLLVGQIFGDGGGEGGFSVIDVADCADVDVGFGSVEFGEGVDDAVL